MIKRMEHLYFTHCYALQTIASTDLSQTMTRTHDIMTSLSASALTLTARLQQENSSLTLTSDLRQSHDAVSTMWPGGLCKIFAQVSQSILHTTTGRRPHCRHHTRPCSAVAPLVDNCCMIVITNIEHNIYYRFIYLSTHYATDNIYALDKQIIRYSRQTNTNLTCNYELFVKTQKYCTQLLQIHIPVRSYLVLHNV